MDSQYQVIYLNINMAPSGFIYIRHTDLFLSSFKEFRCFERVYSANKGPRAVCNRTSSAAGVQWKRYSFMHSMMRSYCNLLFVFIWDCIISLVPYITHKYSIIFYIKRDPARPITWIKPWLNPDFKQHGFCASPLFLQTLGTWFLNEKQNWLSSEKRTLDTEQQSSYFSP